MRIILLIILSLSLMSCGKEGLDNTAKKVLANGDKVVVKQQTAGDLLQQLVTLHDKSGKVLQKSTFTSPNFTEARGFLVDMQQDLKGKQIINFMQGDVSYPLRVYHNGQLTFYKNAEQLQPEFNQVFTPKVQKLIMQQNPYRLFANFQGVMLANGAVWFNKHGIFLVNG
jgi:hypothetical protein